MKPLILAALALAGVASLFGRSAAAADGELWTYFGTYTNSGKSKGIYCYKLDLASGKSRVTAIG